MMHAPVKMINEVPFSTAVHAIGIEMTRFRETGKCPGKRPERYSVIILDADIKARAQQVHHLAILSKCSAAHV